jgi:DNA-binding NarL/FixJ family response regulator
MIKKIMIIEDEALIAESIKMKALSFGYTTTAISDNFSDAIVEFHNEPPDIIISDIFIKGNKSGIDFVKEIVKIRPTPVIFITAFSSESIFNEVYELQNISFLTKPFTDVQLFASLELANKRSYNAKLLEGLSKKELCIVKHLANGLNSKEISLLENISFHTVETHRRNILNKLNIKTTAELVSNAVKSGLI